LWDDQGRRYIDAAGGAAVVNVGHGVEEVVRAMGAQAQSVAYVHGTVFSSQPLEAYSSRLTGRVPLRDPRFYYMTSGSEAVETAVKFARQVQLARGEASRELVIGRWGAYHGATLGTLAVGGKPQMRHHFAPLFRDQPHVPSPYCYRCPYGAAYPACDLACAQALETEILRQGPKRVAAFIGESVGGATLGAVVPPAGYWPRIREICDRYGLLLIADEVMAGFGRTGTWFALEHFDTRPDVMAMGKGATGGYFPLAITTVEAADVDAIRRAHGDFSHGGTYSHHAVGTAVALAVLRYLETHELVTAAAERGAYLGRRLEESLAGLPCVGDVRGLGLLWAVEFVANRRTKEPFPREQAFGRRVWSLAFEQGAVFYPGSGSVDGWRGDHLLIAPPFVVNEAQIDTFVDILAQAAGRAWEESRPDRLQKIEIGS
jgi:adenosylmethionine-8-amino-7-oxononanoate aminotransferase